MFDCKTKTHQQCVFPFESDSKKYHSCSNEVGFGGQLHCAIDDKSLSFGVCGSDCPGGTKNSYSYKLFVLMQNFILLKFVVMIMVFAIFLVVSIALHAELYAKWDLKEINARHVKEDFTLATVSQMVKLIQLLVWVQHVKVSISTLSLTSFR